MNLRVSEDKEAKIKVYLEKINRILAQGIGCDSGETNSFYNPITAGIQIGIIINAYHKLKRLLGYKTTTRGKIEKI